MSLRPDLPSGQDPPRGLPNAPPPGAPSTPGEPPSATTSAAAGRAGRVVAVCLSGRGGVPKRPVLEARVGSYGLEGDYHAGPERTGRRGETTFNHRQVSVVAREALEEVGHELGVAIPWGGFGENVLVEGLGDLADLARCDRLVFEGGVVLEVSEQNQPCRNLSVWHKLVPKAAYGRRGVLATVAARGVLRPGQRVAVERTRRRGDG